MPAVTRAPLRGVFLFMTMLHQRHWTPEQANRLLPVVGATVRRLRDARRRLAERGFDGDLSLQAETTGGAWPGSERARESVEIALGFERSRSSTSWCATSSAGWSTSRP